MPAEDGARWRWLVLPQGRIAEEARGDLHQLRPYDRLALTVMRTTLPEREPVDA